MPTIELNNSRVALIDETDEQLIRRYNWNVVIGKRLLYAFTVLETRAPISMHRFLLKPPASVMVDHINHDGLDNRRCNLRLATRQQNAWNSRKADRTRTSNYKGVTYAGWGKKRKRWRAIIFIKRRRVHLGYFHTQEEAAIAYNEAAQQAFGSFACLNTIETISLE